MDIGRGAKVSSLPKMILRPDSPPRTRYLSPEIKVRRGDVLSAWSGLRPLVRDPAASSSANLVRNHLIHVSASGLITLAGGKWTTYRAMAEETVDRAIQEFKLNAGKCETERVRLVGSDGWSKTMFIRLIQQVWSCFDFVEPQSRMLTGLGAVWT